MFCPNCRDEFRSGFARCERCNVDLVDKLLDPEPGTAAAAVPPPMPLRMVDYCGFFSLQDVRHARDELRRHRIRTEIVVREQPDASWDEPAREEYWIRVDRSRYKDVGALLGEQAADESSDEDFSCGDCGHRVAAAESFCPKCGARFEDS